LPANAVTRRKLHHARGHDQWRRGNPLARASTGSGGRIDGGGLKHLNPNASHAPLSDPQAARGAKRKIDNAAAYPRSTVGNTNYNGLAARKINYANSCAEW
jgi:hypothetical protein